MRYWSLLTLVFCCSCHALHPKEPSGRTVGDEACLYTPCCDTLDPMSAPTVLHHDVRVTNWADLDSVTTIYVHAQTQRVEVRYVEVGEGLGIVPLEVKAGGGNKYGLPPDTLQHVLGGVMIGVEYIREAIARSSTMVYKYGFTAWFRYLENGAEETRALGIRVLLCDG